MWWDAQIASTVQRFDPGGGVLFFLFFFFFRWSTKNSHFPNHYSLGSCPPLNPVNCNLLFFRGCLRGWRLTLHWHRVHSVPCLIQEEPLKREMLCSSVHVLVMSLRMVSAWQGSVTQRGQHSPSGTTVNSQSTGGHGSGQQSTCPCCRGGERRFWERGKREQIKNNPCIHSIAFSSSKQVIHANTHISPDVVLYACWRERLRLMREKKIVS